MSRPYIELLREILQQGVDEGTFWIDDMSVVSHAISTMREYVFPWFRTGSPPAGRSPHRLK